MTTRPDTTDPVHLEQYDGSMGMIGRLQELVAVPSVTGDEAAAQDLVSGWLKNDGFEVIRWDASSAELEEDPSHPGSEVEREVLPLVGARHRGDGDGPTVVLLGHVDVVPPGDPDSWDHPPFEPVIADGRLYGRGACDMKSGVVAMIEAGRRLVDNGHAGELVVVTVPSEEDGGAGTLAAIRAGYVGDLAVIPEPTGLDVVIAHAGAITFRMSIPGRAAHASTRREGVSALDGLAKVLAALAEDEVRRNEAESDPLMMDIGLPYPTIVGKIEGGDWASTVMDRVVIEGRYGVALGQSPAESELGLREVIYDVWRHDDFLSEHPTDIEITGALFGTARLDADHDLPVGLVAAAERVMGSAPEMIGVPYGADMRLLIDEGDTPCVMFGPGDVRQAHSANEYVPVDEVEVCADVLAEWLGDVLGG